MKLLPLRRKADAPLVTHRTPTFDVPEDAAVGVPEWWDEEPRHLWNWTGAPSVPKRAWRLRFPFGVEGYLEPWEGQALFALAREIPAGAAVVELGSYKGRSTICMAQAGRRVLAVDHFAPEAAPDALPDHLAGTYEEAFDENVARWRVGHLVTKHRGGTHGAGAEDAFTTLDAEEWNVGLVFVDAGHEYENVHADAAWWSPVVMVGGVMAFHDTHMRDVHRVVEEMLEGGWVRAGQWGSVRAIRKEG